MSTEIANTKVTFIGDIFIGGDLATPEPNPEIFDLLDNTFSFANLECPITKQKPVTHKSTLFSRPDNIEILHQMSIDAVSIANNHIHDCGTKGILDTIYYLKDQDILFTGAGENIQEASKPIWITDDISIMAFCDFNKPYLSKVQVADKNQPGVNPLRYQHIISCLDGLRSGEKTILYFHWGREHVWTPPPDDIELAKKLSSRDEVLGIIGTHCHRPQGITKYNGKPVYFSIGNFLFPNFSINPKCQYAPPEHINWNKTSGVTRRYPPVKDPIYKKWFRRNRTSIVVLFDMQTKKFGNEIVYQNNDDPMVKPLSKKMQSLIRYLLYSLGQTYEKDSHIYNQAYELNSIMSSITSKSGALYVLFKQRGLFGFLGFLIYLTKRSYQGESIVNAASQWFSTESE